MSIQENLNHIKSTLPKHVTLVAVSKTKPVNILLEAYKAGQRIFGENKIQEMTQKQQSMPNDIEWHMIGHVQSNKVKYMASYVYLIHGVDNLKLLTEINKQAKKHNRIINCLLQIKIADEDSKFGMSVDDAAKTIQMEAFLELQNINIVGVMGMATYTDNQNKVKEEFNFLKTAFNKLKQTHTPNCNMQIISMGMSSDYELAIACGSNMVRIGSSIFGSRN